MITDISALDNLLNANCAPAVIEFPYCDKKVLLGQIYASAARCKMPMYHWTFGDRFSRCQMVVEGGKEKLDIEPLPEADNRIQGDPVIGSMQWILNHVSTSPEIFVLADFHTFLINPSAKSAAREFLVNSRLKNKRIILIGEDMGGFIQEYMSLIRVVDWPAVNATKAEQILGQQVRAVVDRFEGKLINRYNDPPTRQKIISSATGCNVATITEAVRYAAIADGIIGENVASHLNAIKAMALKNLAVEPLQPDEQIPMEEFIGLDVLKKSFKLAGLALQPEARQHKVPMPSGAVLVGFPGCGKSAIAKALCRMWGVVGLRWSIADTFRKELGGTEQQVREILKRATAMAPCVLILDEVDKAFAGLSGTPTDSGVTSRMFGTLLTWLAEKQSEVFVVATANDIAGLPPEFTRCGRFDETFFIPLPSLDERVGLLRLFISRTLPIGAEPLAEEFIKEIAQGTEDFSGADLETLVKKAKYVAYERQVEGGSGNYERGDFYSLINEMKPQGRDKHRFENLLIWAAQYGRCASSPSIAGRSVVPPSAG